MTVTGAGTDTTGGIVIMAGVATQSNGLAIIIRNPWQTIITSSLPTINHGHSTTQLDPSTIMAADVFVKIASINF